MSELTQLTTNQIIKELIRRKTNRSFS